MANKGQFQKGQGGRKRGSRNVMTSQIKTMMIEALERVGGVEYLVRQAEENPRAFMALLAKLIPQEVTGKDGKDLNQSTAYGVLVVPSIAGVDEWLDRAIAPSEEAEMTKHQYMASLSLN